MKLLLVFALFALVCMARSAPTVSTSARQLIFPHYDEDEQGTHEEVKPHEDEIHIDQVGGDDDDDDDDEADRPTTTTTTTRRTPFVFPTRNPNLIPSRRPVLTQRSTTTRMISTTSIDNEQEENVNEYDGDFKYIRDFRKYFQQLMEDIKKIVRNLTGYDFVQTTQRQHYPRNEE